MITVSTDYYSDFRERKYDPDTPDIEFGLRCEGYINEQLNFVTSLNNYNYRNYDFYPLTYSLDRKAFDFLNRAHDKYRRQGYFTAPFLVCCVLRGSDGKCLYISEPEVMTAGLLPPAIELVRYDDFNGCDMHFWLSDSPVFSLMMRIGHLPERLAGRVKYADIYVSPQIPAYTFGGGHNCEYGEVLRSIDAGAGLHGKMEMPGYLRMLEGWYADRSGKFQRHYTDPALADKKVWYVTPNNNLVDMLVNEDRFYHAASIRADRIGDFTSFNPIKIPITLNQWIEGLDRLDEMAEIIDEQAARLSDSSNNSDFSDSSNLSDNSNYFDNFDNLDNTNYFDNSYFSDNYNPNKSSGSATDLPVLPDILLLPIFTSGLSPPGA